MPHPSDTQSAALSLLINPWISPERTQRLTRMTLVFVFQIESEHFRQDAERTHGSLHRVLKLPALFCSARECCHTSLDALGCNKVERISYHIGRLTGALDLL